MRIFIPVFTLLLFVFSSSFSVSQAEDGLKVGDQIPAVSALKIADQNGDVQDWFTQGPMVLVFVRSVDWCPYCQVQLLDLRDVGEAIEENGYRVVTVSYDSSEKLKQFSEKYRFPYKMLSDPSSEIIDAFGIRDESYKGREGIYGIPKPHVYVVDAEGVIEHVLSEETYKKRPAADDVLKATSW